MLVIPYWIYKLTTMYWQTQRHCFLKVVETVIFKFSDLLKKNHEWKLNNSKHDFSWIQLCNEALPISLSQQIYDQQEKALQSWKVAGKDCMWLRASRCACSGVHYIPKLVHFPCPNKPRTVMAIWEHYTEHMTIYFQKDTVDIRRKLCLAASHLWKTWICWKTIVTSSHKCCL